MSDGILLPGVACACGEQRVVSVRPGGQKIKEEQEGGRILVWEEEPVGAWCAICLPKRFLVGQPEIEQEKQQAYEISRRQRTAQFLARNEN